MKSAAVPPFKGQFDAGPRDPGLQTELIVIERAVQSDTGPWHVTGALVKEPESEAVWLDGYVDPNYANQPAVGTWAYLHDKQGGNGYSWEVAFCWIASPADAAAVTAHIDRVLHQEGHPLGYTGGAGAKKALPLAVGQRADFGSEVKEHEEHEEQYEDPCVTHRHVDMPPAAAESLSWKLVAELVRRHPKDLWVLRTYPLDGFYDCLSVRRLASPWDGPTIALNRNGTHVKVDRFDLNPSETWNQESPLMSWGDPYAEEDPHNWLVRLETSAHLAAPHGGLPASTRSSLVIRWIAQFLAIQVGSRPRWTAWTVDEFEPDSAGNSFAAVPPAVQWVRAKKGRHPHLWVWFVGRNGLDRPDFALSADGDLWSVSGDHHMLPSLHTSGGSITDLVLRTAGDVLP